MWKEKGKKKVVTKTNKQTWPFHFLSNVHQDLSATKFEDSLCSQESTTKRLLHRYHVLRHEVQHLDSCSYLLLRRNLFGTREGVPSTMSWVQRIRHQMFNRSRCMHLLLLVFDTEKGGVVLNAAKWWSKRHRVLRQMHDVEIFERIQLLRDNKSNLR